MFMDPCDRIKSIFKSYEFQSNHAKHMASLHKKNFSSVGRELKVMTSKNQETGEKLRQMTEERDKLKQSLERMKPTRTLGAPYNVQRQPPQAAQNFPPGRRALDFEKKNPNAPPQTFPDMTINAFSSKTPAAFKVGNAKPSDNNVLRNFPF